MTKISIGIPVSLAYYKYNIFWHAFFQELNIDLIELKPTKNSIQEGSKYLEPDTCNHLKELIGIISENQNVCSYILLVDLKSVQKSSTICPILANTQTIVTNLFPKVKILSYEIDIQNKKDELTGLVSLGQKLNLSYFEIISAYKNAKRKEEMFYQNQYRISKEQLSSSNSKYLLLNLFYQNFPSLKQFFLNNNAILINSYLDYRYNNLNDLKITKFLDNTFFKEVVKCFENNLDKVNGIILIEEKNCYLSSLTNELIVSKLKDYPILKINPYNVDESSISDFINQTKKEDFN